MSSDKGSIVKVSEGRGRYLISGVGITFQGEGLTVVIQGGDTPHVGAVALAIPRASLRDPHRISATSSVLTLVGHKEDEIAKPFSEKFAKELNQVAVVIAGVHIDEASEQDIEKLIENSRRVVDKLILKLKRDEKIIKRDCR